MQEDTKRKRRGRRKKKSKFGYYLYAVVVLFLTIANITLAIALLTHVQNISVTGNEVSTTSEIIAWVKEDSLTRNSIYTWWKFNYGSYELPVYLDDIDVSLSAPWKVHVKVQEKEIAACLIDKGDYVYFDDEGLVLKKESEHTENVPLIEGLQVENTARYESIQSDDEKALSCAVSIAEEIMQSDLEPDRFVWEEGSMNLYFGEVCVKLGKSNYDEKVMHLSPIMAELQGESGVLNMEHYTSDSKNVSFERNEEKNTQEP